MIRLPTKQMLAPKRAREGAAKQNSGKAKIPAASSNNPKQQPPQQRSGSASKPAKAKEPTKKRKAATALAGGRAPGESRLKLRKNDAVLSVLDAGLKAQEQPPVTRQASRNKAHGHIEVKNYFHKQS